MGMINAWPTLVYSELIYSEVINYEHVYVPVNISILQESRGISQVFHGYFIIIIVACML